MFLNQGNKEDETNMIREKYTSSNKCNPCYKILRDSKK